MTDLLVTKDLSAGVENRVIIDSVNIRISPGESIVILGPNGSGKSTLLRAIAGHPRISIFRGSVFFEDKDVTNMDPWERNSLGIALMHQNPPRLRGIRVRVLLDKIASKKISSLNERVNEIKRVSELLDIGSLLDREFGAGLSGGELKRVELATVILQRPRLALIDEPDSGVDVDSLFVIASAINNLRREYGSSIALVTHTGNVTRYIDVSRGYVLISGRVAAEGDGKELLKKLFSEGFKAFVRRE